MERCDPTIKFETSLMLFVHKEMEINKAFKEGDSYYWGFQEAMEKVLNFTARHKEKTCQLN